MLNYRPLQSGSVDRARQLRRAAPEPERRLLRAVREAFPGHKWRHQLPARPYERHDAARTAFIAREGFRTLRFANGDVMENMEGVLAEISLSLWEREGDPKGRKGEDSQTALSSPRAAARLAPLPKGEGK